jgi:RHS repeat-associated protein
MVSTPSSQIRNRASASRGPARHLLHVGVLISAVLAASQGACSRRDPETAALRQAATISSWSPGISYAIGTLATFNGVTYRCRQVHTSQVGWEPPKTPNLWERPGSAGINPWANQTSYVVGSGVTFNGLVYRCIQAHNSQPDWTPPAAPTLWRVTGNVQIPPGVSGSLAFVFKSKNLPTGIADGFGLVQRDPFGDATYTELLDTKQRSVGEVFHRIKVQGGEILELYLQANKTNVTSSPSMSPATYSSDPTMNTGVDPTFPDHVQQPLQTAAQKAANIWSLRWESFKFGDAGRDGNFNDLTVELRLEVPCNNSMIICTDPNLVVSSHDATVSDYRGDISTPVAPPVPGVPAGPLTDPAGGEGNPMPIGTIALVGGRVDTLRWSFVQESADFSAATPPGTAGCAQCSPPGAAMLGGGLWSLTLGRIHRPRAEAFVSSFGPSVFSSVDAKLTLRPNGIGNQNTIELFDPGSDAPPITFFELSSQDGDSAVDGQYHDNATRTYSSLKLYNSSGSVVADPFSAKSAIATRQSGEQVKFEIINVQGGSGATELQGRLVSVLDRNGNAIAVTYQFAASSTTTQLGGDRRKLWLVNQVTDPHAASATFHYQLRTGTSRWVVQSIDLPNATAVQYQYGASGDNLDRLISIVYPNGNTASFSRAWDAATQSWALTFHDASGGDARTWKTVYVTGSTYTTADSVVHTQEPNLVRRIVNESGEQVYKATEDPNDPNTTFFREGTDRITRLKVDATGMPREAARATNVSADPRLATYGVVESYTGDVLGMIQAATDGLGNTRTFGRDSKTRAITSVAPRGGASPATFTLNSFLQPTQTVDRLGRMTTVGYDSKGNPLTITHAVGTAAQAAWQYIYNSKGQVTRLTDANNKVTDYAYNAAGFLSSITEPADVTGGSRPVKTFEYDAAGRLVASVDAAGNRVTFAYDSRGRLQTTSYPDGTSETITYGTGTAAGLPVSRTDRNGIVEQHQYDATRRLTRTIQAAGRPEQIATNLEYAAGTNEVSARTVAGNRVELSHDERLRPITRKVFTRASTSLTWLMSWDTLDRDVMDTDPYGRRIFHVYDVNGREVRTVTELVPGGVPGGSNPASLARVTTGNPPYVIQDRAYDSMNQVTSTTDGRGIVTTQEYDGQGRRKALVQAVGTAVERKTTFEYDANGNVTKQTDPRTFTEGQTFQTVSTYSDRNLLKTRTEASGSADAASTSYTYTRTGKLATTTDPRAGVTTYAYDSSDRLASVTDAAGFTTSYTYDGIGNQTSVTNPLGNTTKSAYDGLNRLVTQSNPLEQATRYTYDDDLTDGVGLDADYADAVAGLGLGANARGSAVRTTNAAGESTVQFRDGSGRTILSINASANATGTTYDLVTGGLVETAVTNPLGNVTRQRADGAGRARVTVDAAGKTATRSFDPTGNLLSERDANNVGQDCAYDALGQRTSCTDTQGDSTSRTYDAAGNQTGMTDGNGVHTTCTFDFRNRKKSCTDGVGATTTWAYDGSGNLTSITDGEGSVTTYAYDARNLRTTETYPDSSGPTDQVRRTYDAAGRLASKTDQGGNTITYTYDTADRLTQKADPDGKADSFLHDAIGRLTTGTSQRYGTTVTMTYDGGGRLATEGIFELTTESGYTVTYGYDAADRQTSLQYPDGRIVQRSYTSRGQLQAVSLGAQSIASYAYDDGGRLATSTLGNGLVETRTFRSDNTVASISTPGVGDFTYTYDHKKQKLTEGGAATNGAQTFTYDNQGRLSSWAGGSGGALTQTWSLSPVGDWQSTTRESVVENRTHNAAHELTAIGAAPLSYDARGNLVTDDAGHSLSWDFDNKIRTYGAGESSVSYTYDVLGRKVMRVVGSSTTIFVHAGEEVVAEYENGSLRTDFVLGAEIDRPIAYLNGSNLNWYSANALGTIAAVTDSGGAVLERYRYDAYGARSALSPDGATRALSAVANDLGFTGRYHDGFTGLLDFRFRQYSAQMGRFISRDDDYRDVWSLYTASFVPNRRDPTGHFSQYVGGVRTGGTLTVNGFQTDEFCGPWGAVAEITTSNTRLTFQVSLTIMTGRCLLGGDPFTGGFGGGSIGGGGGGGILGGGGGGSAGGGGGTSPPGMGPTAPPHLPPPTPDEQRNGRWGIETLPDAKMFALNAKTRAGLQPYFSQWGVSLDSVRITLTDNRYSRYIPETGIIELGMNWGGMDPTESDHTLVHELAHMAQYKKLGYGPAEMRFTAEGSRPCLYSRPPALRSVPINMLNITDDRFTLEQIANHVGYSLSDHRPEYSEDCH